jgi:pyruvate dehydrogenase E2 component (dihydrolipoamide acetyltransferase)
LASKEIHVPDLGSFKDVAVIDVLVHPGEQVQVDTPLLTLETEKATMDVPSPEAGIVEKLHIGKGGRVSAGTLIATLKVADAGAAASAPGAAPAAAAAPDSATAPGSAAPARAAAAVPTPVPATATPAPGVGDALRAPVGLPQLLPAINEEGFARAHASPSVRKFARELGVDLARVRGGGQNNRITHADVKAFVKAAISGSGAAAAGAAALPQINIPDFAQFGAIEVKPLSRVQRISGPRLQAAWINLPHVTQFDEADITELESAREKLKLKAAAEGIKLTPLAFIIRACVKALQHFPQFNASLDASGENLVLKKYIHIGFAADTPNGLLVPVIRDANHKDVYELARALAELSEKARSGKLSGAEMQGGSFTVSSLGGIGGTAFTPIINAPEVAILGVSRSSVKPLYRDGSFVPRLLLPLSLSYDHRVIDGAAGARFSAYLTQTLADVRGLLEAVP